MIRNIVFDMGNVLVDYDGDLVCRALIPDEEMRKRIYTTVFVSPEWVKLDMGIISEEQGLKAMVNRLDTPEEKEAAARCFAQWHLYNMRPKKGMEELTRQLKEKGYGLYICSNASVRLLECYRDVIPAIDCFDGVLFSAEDVRASVPALPVRSRGMLFYRRSGRKHPGRQGYGDGRILLFGWKCGRPEKSSGTDQRIDGPRFHAGCPEAL